MHRTPLNPPLVLVAHGTRDPAGPRVVERIAAAAADRLATSVRAAYVDVIGPSVGEVLREIDGPAVVLPAFLAAGYHVRADLPEQLGAERRRVLVTAPLGPAPELAAAMRDRLAEVGWRPGRSVLFSAAGSADPRARADVRRAADLLGGLLRQRLGPSYLTTAHPTTAEVAATTAPAFLAPYLLAPGAFHRELAALPGVAARPIGDHPGWWTWWSTGTGTRSAAAFRRTAAG
ncbi:sirohydrochlorin chelatase [Saccharopolyspora sp. CA-218241]|uniref:sirohydrochlorin chelatase n=1 Tax=Saccharopolyspora sp. CA-218241 TaxID=3240027 RepID=UPI003D977BCC